MGYEDELRKQFDKQVQDILNGGDKGKANVPGVGFVNPPAGHHWENINGVLVAVKDPPNIVSSGPVYKPDTEGKSSQYGSSRVLEERLRATSNLKNINPNVEFARNLESNPNPNESTATQNPAIRNSGKMINSLQSSLKRK